MALYPRLRWARTLRHDFLGPCLRMLPCLTMVASVLAGPSGHKGSLKFQSIPSARYSFEGVVGERIDADLQQWLLRAPGSNPGMLEMFRTRDRKPSPELVPWAGEFAGKYLISAVQALRMTESEELRPFLARFVSNLISAQAEDGYLGPFPRSERLRGNWDLWGHYHIMEGLLLWHEHTGDPAALKACRRIADLVCSTYLDQPRRIYDAGSHEMNMAMIHGLALLYQICPEERYLRMIHEIEKDWERAGDYFRMGLSGTEFFASPRPRWESLHDLQGLAELWRITGNPQYVDSFTHHWRSIARWDIHNTGAFSGGEQATGNPYAPSAIETCCTVAWMALSVDMLRLSGDSLVADQLELTTLNGALGAQHPSGNWWTYSTPMDGFREASAHSIVFQARAGTPELNCCSVNGPRALGMLSEWAIMRSGSNVVLNWHGPASYVIRGPNQKSLELACESGYPQDGHISWTVKRISKPSRFSLHFRIPGWSTNTALLLNGRPLQGAQPGHYYASERKWKKGDRVELRFDMGLRVVPGAQEAMGKASVYRGPLLVAFDQSLNPFDESAIPSLTTDLLQRAKVVPRAQPSGVLEPWLSVDIPSTPAMRLCDYASAGAKGTRYRSWLPFTPTLPPPAVSRLPADGATIGGGSTLFRWTTRTNAELTRYRLQVASSADFAEPILDIQSLPSARFHLEMRDKERLPTGNWCYWRILTTGPGGQTLSPGPYARFRFDPNGPVVATEAGQPLGPESLALHASLSGSIQPQFGELHRATAFETDRSPRDGAAIRLNGLDQLAVYRLPDEFEQDFSVAVWVKVLAFPTDRIGQVFSCWAASMDDPLRLTVANGQLSARVEAQQAYSTKGVPIEAGKWHHVAAVKAGSRLTLFLDGQRKEQVEVPVYLSTRARSCAIGGNPNYSGNECLNAAFSDLSVWFRALSPQELERQMQPSPGK